MSDASHIEAAMLVTSGVGERLLAVMLCNELTMPCSLPSFEHLSSWLCGSTVACTTTDGRPERLDRRLLARSPITPLADLGFF